MRTKFAVVLNREPVRFVSDADKHVAIFSDGIVQLRRVKEVVALALRALGNSHDGDVYFHFSQNQTRGVNLRETAVDED